MSLPSPASSRASVQWTTELPIYFINTDESRRREAYIHEVFGNSSASGLCRVRGVQGNDAADVLAHLEVPPNVTLWRYARWSPRQNTVGTLALFASHVEAIAAAYDAGHAAALVLEDDSVPLLPQLWDFALDDLLQLIPQKYPLQVAQPEPFYKSDRGFSTRCVLAAKNATVKSAEGAGGRSPEGAVGTSPAGVAGEAPEGAAPAPEAAAPVLEPSVPAPEAAALPPPPAAAAPPPPEDAGGDGTAAAGGDGAQRRALSAPREAGAIPCAAGCTGFSAADVRDARGKQPAEISVVPARGAENASLQRGEEAAAVSARALGARWGGSRVERKGAGDGRDFDPTAAAGDAGGGGGGRSRSPGRRLAPSPSRAAKLPTEPGHSVVRDAVNSLLSHSTLRATTFEALEPRTDRGRHLWENFRGLNWQQYAPEGGEAGAAQAPEAAETGETGAAAASQDWDTVRLAYGWEHDSLWVCNQRHGSAIGVGCPDAVAYGVNSTAPDPLLTNDCDEKGDGSSADLSRFRTRFAELLEANMTVANVTELHDRMHKAGTNANFETQRLLNFMAEKYMAAAAEEMAKPSRAASPLEEARLQMPPNGVTVPSKEAFAVRVFQLQHCLPLGLIVGRKTAFLGGGLDRYLKRMNQGRCPFNEPPVLPPPEEEEPAAKMTAKGGAKGAAGGASSASGGARSASGDSVFGGDERLRATVPVRAYHPLLHTCSHGPQYGAVAYVVSRAGMEKVVARMRDATTGRVKCLEDSGGLPGDSRGVPCLSDWALFHVLRRAYCVSPRLFSVHMFEGSTHVRGPMVANKQAKRKLEAFLPEAAAPESALPPEAVLALPPSPPTAASALSPAAALGVEAATTSWLPQAFSGAALPPPPPLVGSWGLHAVSTPATDPTFLAPPAEPTGDFRSLQSPPRLPRVDPSPAQTLGRPRAWLGSRAPRRLADGAKPEPLDKPNDHMRVHYQYVVDAVGDMLNDAWLEATLAAPVGPAYRHPMPHVFPFVYWVIARKSEFPTIDAAVVDRVLLDSRVRMGEAVTLFLLPLVLLMALSWSCLLRKRWRTARSSTTLPATSSTGAASDGERTFPVGARQVFFAVKQFAYQKENVQAGQTQFSQPAADLK